MKKHVFAVILALFCLLSATMTVCADETEESAVYQVSTEVNGDVPQTVKNLLTQQAYIGKPERLTRADVESIQTACQQLFSKSLDGRVEIPTDVKNAYEMLKDRDMAECTASYVYTMNATDNGLTTEYIYYLDGTVIKTVSYDLNGVRYTAFNHDNRVIMIEGTAEDARAKETVKAMNLSDVLFGFVIAVVIVMIIAAIVITKKRRNER